MQISRRLTSAAIITVANCRVHRKVSDSPSACMGNDLFGPNMVTLLAEDPLEVCQQNFCFALRTWSTGDALCSGDTKCAGVKACRTVEIFVSMPVQCCLALT